jgi:hypothetical protein
MTKDTEALLRMGPGEFFVDGDKFDLIFRPDGGSYGGDDKIVARMACGETAYFLPSIVARLLNAALATPASEFGKCVSCGIDLGGIAGEGGDGGYCAECQCFVAPHDGDIATGCADDDLPGTAEQWRAATPASDVAPVGEVQRVSDPYKLAAGEALAAHPPHPAPVDPVAGGEALREAVDILRRLHDHDGWGGKGYHAGKALAAKEDGKALLAALQGPAA